MCKYTILVLLIWVLAHVDAASKKPVLSKSQSTALLESETCTTCHVDDLPQTQEEVHGMDSVLIDNKKYQHPDSEDALTQEWIKKPAIRDALAHNLIESKIATDTLKDATAINKFAADWMEKAHAYPKTKADMTKQQDQYAELIKNNGLTKLCSPPTVGLEALWSGHISASKLAEKEGRKPLESTEFARALSYTFGSEWYSTALKKIAFKDGWVPSFAGMFNTVSLTYSSNMKPAFEKKEKTLPIYMNQLKVTSVLFDFELNMVLKNTEIHNLEFIIVNPPETKDEEVHRYLTLNVDVSVDATALGAEVTKAKDEAKKFKEEYKGSDQEVHTIIVPNNGDATVLQKKILILNKFRQLEESKVKQLWDKKFALEFCRRDQAAGATKAEMKCEMSHPMNEKSGFGNRDVGTDAKKMYTMFFFNCPADLPDSKGLAVSASLEQQSNSSFLLLCTFGLFSFCFVLSYWFSAKQSSQSHLEVEFYNEF